MTLEQQAADRAEQRHQDRLYAENLEPGKLAVLEAMRPKIELTLSPLPVVELAEVSRG